MGELGEMICRRCRTGDNVEVIGVEPEGERVIPLPGGGKRVKPVAPVAHFRCRKCGEVDGHSMPLGWEPPQ